MSQFVTFDWERFYADALNARGDEMTWKEAAEEMGMAASTFTRLKQGKTCSVDTLVKIAEWTTLEVDEYIKRGTA